MLRRKPFGQLLPSAHAVDREYRLLAALHPLGFPVPQPLALCDDPEVIGAMFYVMEMARGRPYANGALPEFDPATRRSMYEQLVDTLADLHVIDPNAAGLADFGKPGNYFERQVARWTRQYRDSETDYLPEMERLIAFLPETLPEQSRASIVHGDYRIDNVVFDGDGTLTAVLDWELATLGDPVADFSYLAMQWAMPADGAAGLAGLDLAELGIPDARKDCRSATRNTRAFPSPASSTGISPIICSACRASSRASRSGSSTGPQAMPRRLRWPSGCRCCAGGVGLRGEGRRLAHRNDDRPEGDSRRSWCSPRGGQKLR